MAPFDGTRWYAARVHHGQEQAVAQRVAEKLGIDTYSPSYVMNGNTWGPVFGCYSFFAFDMQSDEWERINKDRNVVKLLPIYREWPTPFPSRVIDECREREIKGDFVVNTPGRLALKYAPGERVKITHGAVSGMHATFVRQERDKAIIETKILGHLRNMEVPAVFVGDYR